MSFKMEGTLKDSYLFASIYHWTKDKAEHFKTFKLLRIRTLSNFSVDLTLSII